MPALSNRDLASIRQAAAELLPDRCHLLTKTTVSNGQGGQTATWGTASANVPCRLDMMHGMETLTGGALQQYTGYMLSMPHDTTITQSYRVLLNDITYAVKAVNTNQSWPVVKRVELEKV